MKWPWVSRRRYEEALANLKDASTRLDDASLSLRARGEDAGDIAKAIDKAFIALNKYRGERDAARAEIACVKAEAEAAKLTAHRNEDGSVTVVDSRGDEEVVYAFDSVRAARAAADGDNAWRDALVNCHDDWEMGYRSGRYVSSPIAGIGHYEEPTRLWVHSCGWRSEEFKRNTGGYEDPPDTCPRCAARVK